MRIALCPVHASDGPRLAELRAVAMRESLERVGRFDELRVRQRLLDGFAPQWTRHVVDSGLEVGFVVVRPDPSLAAPPTPPASGSAAPAPQHALLDHLYIAPAHQGKGLGAAVLALVFAEADALRQRLRVGALKHSAANRFYLRHGFSPCGEGEWDAYYERWPA